MYGFSVAIEGTETGYPAYSPDLLGCVATGATREEVEKNMHDAVELHVPGLIEDNPPAPESTTLPSIFRSNAKTVIKR